MVQLQEAQSKFRQRGINLAAISYDNEAILREFGARFQITYPLLSDPHSELIRRFGLLDPDNGPSNLPDYAKKDMAYPGFIYADSRSIIKEKFFGVSYFDRYTANNLICKLFPELIESSSGRTTNAPQLDLTLRQSDKEATLGSRVTLAADIKLRKGMHVYAPEVKGYQPIQLVIDSTDLVRLKEAKYAQSEELFLPAIKERVPVYRGQFRVAQDVMVMPTRKLQEDLSALGEGREKSMVLTIRGRLKYQACDAEICYPPREVPLSWEVRVHLPDNIRSSESIQDHPN